MSDWEGDIDLRDADVPPPIAYLLGHWSTYTEQHEAAGRPRGAPQQVVAELRAQGYRIDMHPGATIPSRTA